MSPRALQESRERHLTRPMPECARTSHRFSRQEDILLLQIQNMLYSSFCFPLQQPGTSVPHVQASEMLRLCVGATTSTQKYTLRENIWGTMTQLDSGT